MLSFLSLSILLRLLIPRFVCFLLKCLIVLFAHNLNTHNVVCFVLWLYVLSALDETKVAYLTLLKMAVCTLE